MAASWDRGKNEIKTELKRRRKERERWETEIILLVKHVGLLRSNCRREALPLGWINLLVSHMTEGGGPGAGGERERSWDWDLGCKSQRRRGFQCRVRWQRPLVLQEK